jgi:hypothetical protein
MSQYDVHCCAVNVTEFFSLKGFILTEHDIFILTRNHRTMITVLGNMTLTAIHYDVIHSGVTSYVIHIWEFGNSLS